jgi:AcrR family transcriptional regulator
MSDLSVKKSRRCTDEAMLAFREEILESATALFAEQGFSDAVTQSLAAKLQVGKGTIYRHFPSKRELFLAAADRVMQKLQERVEANILGITDGFDRVTHAVAAFLGFFAEHPQYVELLIQERAYFKDRQRPTYFEHREINIERWRQLYRALIAGGRVREMPVERITDVVSNMLYGIMVTNFFNGQAKPSEVQARELLDVVFCGIFTESERLRRAAAADGCS